MTKLSNLAQASRYENDLNKLRRFRQEYVGKDSSPEVTLGRTWSGRHGMTGDATVTLSAAAREQVIAALDLEEAALIHKLKELGVEVDEE
jgi:hypothetical protein